MVRGKRSERVFAVGEAYHVYNRGVEKRTVVEDSHDSDRFVKSLIAFNTTEPIGSIYQHSFKHNITPLSTPSTKLVRSSWLQYSEGKKGICSTGIITDGFKSSEGYKKFAEQTVQEIIRDRARSTDDSYKKELYATYFE